MNARPRTVRELPVGSLDVLGMSRGARAGLAPIQGLRVKPEGGASGWFIWSGDDTTFFEPMCVAHACAVLPVIEPYMHLPPGWRFIVTESYADAWLDHEA